MAEGFLKSLDPELEVYSAGTNPSNRIHPLAIQVMQEVGIDISLGHPKDVNQFLNRSFDYVITVCDNARETCPVFLGDMKEQLHIGFEDPAQVTGTDEQVLEIFRKVRDEIKRDFGDLGERTKVTEEYMIIYNCRKPKKVRQLKTI
jgi:arsenate reductase